MTNKKRGFFFMESRMYYLDILLYNATAFDVYRREGKGCIKILIISPARLHAFINIYVFLTYPYLF